MAIRSKRKKEIEEDNAQMSTLISHHRIKIPGVKTEGLKKTTEESIAHIINPQNKQDYKKHLLALKKRKSLEHFENSLGKDEMLIVATKKRFDHRMLAYCIYGNGETPEPLQGMNLHTPSSLKNIHIIVEKEPYFKKLSLRPLIAKRLLEYLKNADLKTDDCIQFMYHMSGITQLYAKKKDDWK